MVGSQTKGRCISGMAISPDLTQMRRVSMGWGVTLYRCVDMEGTSLIVGLGYHQLPLFALLEHETVKSGGQGFHFLVGERRARE